MQAFGIATTLRIVLVSFAAMLCLASCGEARRSLTQIRSANSLPCTTCHGYPPAVPHPTSTECRYCHSDVVGTDGKIADAQKHMDGDVQVYQNTEATACVSCHTNKRATVSLSSHPTDASTAANNRAACQGCHDVTNHMTQLRIIDGSGVSAPLDSSNSTAVDNVCKSCHSGTGRVLSGKTPPAIPGYFTFNGDFHGTRVGGGYGGTLKAPYTRGQAALPCKTCHGSHLGKDAFIFASTVNGTTIPPTPIPRSGVGAEVLCRACHVGDNHAGCIGCHGADPRPAGTACFVCHGHEGIVQFEGIGSHYSGGCHCHSAWLPTDPTIPSIDAASIQINNVTATTATITWNTTTFSSSFVEYGIGAPTTTKGVANSVAGHSVTLTGLTEHTTYTFRVRSANAFRDFAQSSLRTFTTAWTNGPIAPTPVHLGNAGVTASPWPITFQWSTVTLASGNPVEYRLEVATDYGFTNVVVNTGWISGTSHGAALPVLGGNYYWRVTARDATLDLQSPPSPIESFLLYINTGGC